MKSPLTKAYLPSLRANFKIQFDILIHNTDIKLGFDK
jgi:hypothetical protein